MARERRGGPVSMSADELATFLDSEPTGAICVTDADGRLLALPAHVLGMTDGVLQTEIVGFDAPPVPGAAACVVADRFTTYEAIRGVIVQGSLSTRESSEPPSRSTISVAVDRTVTFSFANVAT